MYTQINDNITRLSMTLICLINCSQNRMFKLPELPIALDL